MESPVPGNWHAGFGRAARGNGPDGNTGTAPLADSYDGSHHVRDVSWAEDASQVRTGSGPAVMAALRSFAIGALRAIGSHTNIAKGQRWAARNYDNPLSILDLKM